MPTTKLYGTPGSANQAIGGVPNVHYFDFQSKGRGQVIRLLFEDAGIAYNDTRYSFDEYPTFKNTTLKEWNPLDTIPVVELNGRILIRSYAILRHFARQLGKYDGETEEEKYWTDAMCDAGIDWRTQFVTNFLSPNSSTDYPQYCKTTRPTFLHGIDRQLRSHPSSTSGPFVVGKEITYADLVIYQVAHDEGMTKDGYKELKEGGYDRLAELCRGVEEREGVRAFLKSERYLG